MKKAIELGSKIISSDNPAYIVAELSSNHLNDYEVVEKTVRAAADAGVDAIKLATLTPDTMTINSDKDDFMINSGSKWDGRRLYDLYTETSMPYEWHERIIELAGDLGLDCFSTPYDKSAADFLFSLDVPAYKIASFEITDIPLIEKVASYQKPVIISTGIATKEDITEALDACRRAGNEQVILLKCTSGYPAPFEDLNLKTIKAYQRDFDVLVGLSDHTLGIEVPVASVMLGTKFIEKHIILDRKLGGPDAHFSLEPADFKDLVSAVRNIEKAMGIETYELTESSSNSRRFSRSLYVVEEVKKGERFSEKSVRSIRPGYGLSPKYYDKVLNSRAARDIEAGTRLDWNLIEKQHD